MKNRDYKQFTPGTIFHIYNRGNNKEKIFFEEGDYKAFMFRLGLVLGFDVKELQQHDLTRSMYSRIRITKINKNDILLHAFCLEPNHFHLLLEQCGEVSISKLMLKLSTSFAMYINKKHRRVGHVFQDQFKSVPIESNSQLMWTISYIHMNPVKDRLAKKPENYTWSSYKDFKENRNIPIISKNLVIPLFGNKENFIKETTHIMPRVPLDINPWH